MVETGTMHTEIVYNEEKTRRYRLSKTWDESKPRAMVLMTNASTADVISIDYTTLYTIRNLNANDFGAVDILNMSSIITVKLEIPKDGEIVEETENISHIIQSAEKADKILIAWGKLGENNKKVRQLQLKILEKLRPFKDKLFGITNEWTSNEFFHPLAPQIRFEWLLKPFELPKPLTTTEEAKQGKNAKTKKSPKADVTDLPLPEAEKTEETA
jgi:hypothetical protein